MLPLGLLGHLRRRRALVLCVAALLWMRYDGSLSARRIVLGAAGHMPSIVSAGSHTLGIGLSTQIFSALGSSHRWPEECLRFANVYSGCAGSSPSGRWTAR